MSSSFQGFCALLGLQNVGPYMRRREADKLEDWSSVPLDNQGRQIQEEMTKKFQVANNLLDAGEMLTATESSIERHQDNVGCLYG